MGPSFHAEDQVKRRSLLRFSAAGLARDSLGKVACMEALVTCRCRHTILAHETGRCSAPGCDCRNSRYGILDDEIDGLKTQHTAKPTTLKTPAL